MEYNSSLHFDSADADVPQLHAGEYYENYPCFDSYDFANEDRTYQNYIISKDPDCLPDGTQIYYDRELKKLAFKIESVKEKKSSYIIYNATAIEDYGDFPPHFRQIEVVELFLANKDARYVDGHSRVSYSTGCDCNEFFDLILEDSKLSIRQIVEFYNDEYGISKNFVKANNTYYYIKSDGHVDSPWQHFGSGMNNICNKCGRPCNTDYLYYPKCGEKLDDESKDTPKWMKWCLRGVLLMIVWYISYLLFHK